MATGQPVIGRVYERSVLAAALERAAAGGSSMVIMEGEAGIGKTRLADWAREEAGRRSYRVLAGSAPPLSGPDLPFSPFVAALHEVFDWPTTFRGGNWKVGDGRALVFEGVVTRLAEVASTQPVLVVLEDLHWAGQSTWDLLSYLAGNLARIPANVIVTLRRDPDRDDIRRWLTELRRHPWIEVLTVQRLLDEELAEIIAGHTGSWQLKRIVSVAQGNPFTGIELARVRTGDAIPDSLSDAVRARVDSCSEDVRAVLAAMSVCDHDIDDRLLGAVAGLTPSRLAQSLRAAVDRGLVVSTGDQYQLRHALTRAVIHGDMLPAQRRAYHAAFAEKIEQGGRNSPADVLNLAHHWHQAGVPSKAAPLAYRAGMLALRGRAFPEASRLLQRAADLWRDGDQPEQDYPLVLAHAAEAARWAGEPTEAVRLISRSLELPAAQADPVHRAKLLERLGRYQWESGWRHEMVSAYEQAELALAGRQQPGLLAEVLAAHATGLMIIGEYAPAQDLAVRAVDLARQSGALPAEGHAAATLGVLHAHAQAMDEAVAQLRRAQEIARQCADVEVAIRATVNLSYVFAITCRFEEAVEAIAEGRALISDLGGALSTLADLDHNIVAIHVATGHYDDALRLIDELAARPVGAMASYLLVLRLEVAVARGDTTQARSLADALREQQAGPRLVTTVEACEAEMDLWQDNHARAAARVSSGLAALSAESDYVLGCARLVATGFRALADQAAAPRRPGAPAGPPPLAAAFTGELEQRLAWLMTRAGSEPEADAFILTAQAEQSRLRPKQGSEWREARDAWAQARRPYREAYAVLRLAEKELRQGHRDRAGSMLRTAGRIARELGAQPLADQVRRTAQAARLDAQLDEASSVGGNAAFDGLTSRERQVLALLVSGSTNRVIARELYITERTAAVHVSNVLQKLGVRNRTEAVAEALRHQLP